MSDFAGYWLARARSESDGRGATGERRAGRERRNGREARRRPTRYPSVMIRASTTRPSSTTIRPIDGRERRG